MKSVKVFGFIQSPQAAVEPHCWNRFNYKLPKESNKNRNTRTDARKIGIWTLHISQSGLTSHFSTDESQSTRGEGQGVLLFKLWSFEELTTPWFCPGHIFPSRSHSSLVSTSVQTLEDVYPGPVKHKFKL